MNTDSYVEIAKCIAPINLCNNGNDIGLRISQDMEDFSYPVINFFTKEDSIGFFQPFKLMT